MLKGNFHQPNPATITKISMKIVAEKVVKTSFQKLSNNEFIVYSKVENN
jgi:hypothetical protein